MTIKTKMKNKIIKPLNPVNLRIFNKNNDKDDKNKIKLNVLLKNINKLLNLF